MFKRGEESEWSRFSKAFTGKERDREEATEFNPEPEATIRTLAPDPDEVVYPSPPSPAARPPTSDTNLTVARTGSKSSVTSGLSDDVESTIGEHTFFDGTYRSEESIRIRGTAQGEIECARAVFIEENARVAAKVSASTIMVAGEVSGELNCTGRVEIRPSGRVTGTITAASLVMQEGAFFDGNLRMKQEAEVPAASQN